MPRIALLLFTSSLAVVGCSTDGFLASPEARSDSSGDGGSTWNGDADGSGGAGDSSDTWEPEEENPFGGLAPASTPDFVFIANPDRDTLTRVSVPEMEVITVAVGSHPSVVATTSDFSRAVVFNEGSDDVSIVEAESLTVRTVAVRDDLNQLLLSPDGRFAICFHDEDAVDPDDPEPEGAQSFSEVSVLDLDSGVHTPMVVGFDPKQVLFDDAGDRALVVSDAYLGVIDLRADPPALHRIALTSDTVDPPVAEEVVLTPDGSAALVRQFGATVLLAIDLDTEQVSPVDVGANPTDLDVMPDGIHAIAISRAAHEAWIYDLSDPTAEAQVVPLPTELVVGGISISATGTEALLYSTAAHEALYATWDLTAADLRDGFEVHGLVKPISSVQISPTGETALFLHTEEDADGMDPDSPFFGQWALTVVDMSDQFQSPLLLKDELRGFSETEDGTLGFFILDNQPWLESIDYHSLLFDEVALPSLPDFVGVQGDTHLAWVSQQHDLGRISFYDADEDTLETVTGFELNDGIVVH